MKYIKKYFDNYITSLLTHELTHSLEFSEKVKNNSKHITKEILLNHMNNSMKNNDLTKVSKDWFYFLNLVYLNLSFEVNARIPQLYSMIEDKDMKTQDDFWTEVKKTNVWEEMLLLKDFNDNLTDAERLTQFTKKFPCKINLIEYNNTNDKRFKKSHEENVKEFVGLLESKNIITNVRTSRGEDIDAACGQLANKIK